MEDKGVKDTRIGELPEASQVTSLSWFLPPGLEDWTMIQCCQLRCYCIPASSLGWPYVKVELDVAWSTEHGICCSDAQQVVRMKDEGRMLDDELTGAIGTA